MTRRWLALAAMTLACGGRGGRDDHDDHDEARGARPPAGSSRARGGAGDDHDDRAGHDDHSDRDVRPAAPGTVTDDDHDDHDHDRPAEVRIADDMLRDLRLTSRKAESRTAGERVTALGELALDQDAYAEVAAPAPARVLRVLARAGEQVTAGQVLVELDSPDLGAARAASEAARVRVELARAQLERRKALAGERLVTEAEVHAAEAALAEAQADARVAAAGLAPFTGALGRRGLGLRAPIAGTVLARDVALGQRVDPSRTLYRIGDLSRLWLIAHVFERDAVRVRTGTTGTASFAALPGRTIDGTITWLGPEVEPSSRTIPIRLELANPDGALRPGMSATVSLPLDDSTATVVTVPLAAVQRVDERWAVFLPRGAGVFEVRPIGRGRELAGEVEVLSGLAPGDEVVVDGAFLLKAESDKAHGGGDHDHH